MVVRWSRVKGRVGRMLRGPVLDRRGIDVVPADLQTCAEDEGAAAGPWSQGVSALTVDMVNCVGGEPEGGWESMPWGAISCKAGCFDN